MWIIEKMILFLPKFLILISILNCMNCIRIIFCMVLVKVERVETKNWKWTKDYPSVLSVYLYHCLKWVFLSSTSQQWSICNKGQTFLYNQHAVESNEWLLKKCHNVMWMSKFFNPFPACPISLRISIKTLIVRTSQKRE